FQQPLIFRIKSAMITMGYSPNRSDRLAIYVERNKQSLFGKRHRRAQVRITAFPMGEQHRPVAVENVPTRAEIARGTSPNVWSPSSRNSRPVKSLAIFCQQTYA